MVIRTDLNTKAQLAAYLHGALSRAVYEELPDGEGIYAEIAGFQGVWANAPTFEACQAELSSALQDWIDLRLAEGLDLPQLQGFQTPAAA